VGVETCAPAGGKVAAWSRTSRQPDAPQISTPETLFASAFGTAHNSASNGSASRRFIVSLRWLSLSFTTATQWRFHRLLRGTDRRPGLYDELVEDRPLSEERLIAQAKRGAASAYEQLVRDHQTIAFRTAYLITGSAEEAEDATQEAFVKAHAALGQFREGAPFRPWVLRIVANEARNRRKATARREYLTLRARQERRPGDAVPSPEAALLASAQHDQLLNALNRLPERDRLAIACRYLLELSESETAAALGCPRGTVKSRLARALDRLRVEIGARDD
jgi:RNA polymerase sigma factor (sigma-70 family)